MMRAQESTKGEFEAKAHVIMESLSEEADMLSERLKEYQMVCGFCGEMMGDNVNRSCDKNVGRE